MSHRETSPTETQDPAEFIATFNYKAGLTACLLTYRKVAGDWQLTGYPQRLNDHAAAALIEGLRANTETWAATYSSIEQGTHRTVDTFEAPALDLRLVIYRG